MKYTILFFIAAVLFSSCDITKRRYLPGYSIEWRHKAPKTIVNKNAVNASANIIAAKRTNINTPAQPITINGTSEKISLSSITIKPTSAWHSKSTVTNAVAANSEIPSATNATVDPKDKKPVFFTGDEQEDDYARKSLTDGILALGFPAATFLVMLAIALSVGETVAGAPAYSVAIFILGCALGLFFAVFAFINGFHAINEINGDPDTYTGKSQAILGMILAALEPIGIIVFLLIRSSI